jgi:hypothetical protein
MNVSRKQAHIPEFAVIFEIGINNTAKPHSSPTYPYGLEVGVSCEGLIERLAETDPG